MTFLPQQAVPAAATVALVLAQQPGTNDKPGEEEFGKSSPVGLVVLLLFLVAVVLLVRSMTKHLKRIPKSFESDGTPSGGEPAPPAPTETSGVAGTEVLSDSGEKPADSGSGSGER